MDHVYGHLLSNCSHVPLKRDPIHHYITYGTAITEAENESDLIITTHTSYLAHPGELWGVYWYDFGEN